MVEEVVVSRKARKDFGAKLVKGSLSNQSFEGIANTPLSFSKHPIWDNLNFLSALCVIFTLRALREINYQELININ